MTSQLVQQTATPEKSPALGIRPATSADLPFLAWCEYESALPPTTTCYWDELLDGLGTATDDFLQAYFASGLAAWGGIDDFRILELDGVPVAAAAGFEPHSDDYRPLRLERLPALAERLGWSIATTNEFRTRYEQVWGGPHNAPLKPQAPWIIECVAVKPAFRGRGLVRILLQALLAAGRRRGHSHAGISVINGNETARRVYESLGFEMYIAYGPAYFDGMFSGATKYRLALTPQTAPDPAPGVEVGIGPQAVTRSSTQ